MAWNTPYTNNPELLAVAVWDDKQIGKEIIIILLSRSSMVNNHCLHCCA